MKTKFIWLAVVVAAITGLMTVYFGYPPAAAAMCPSCFGLSVADSNVFIEETTDKTDAAIATTTIAHARDRVREFYGTLQSNPRILVCLTEACYQRIGGGGSTGMALLDFALLLSPRGNKIVIASHEMAHIELHRRIGLVATVERRIPQWFDEGLAALVSQDPRYLKPEGVADRCITSSAQDLPTARSAWVVEARNRQLYAKAACRVFRWTSAHGGSEAVLGLVFELSQGKAFSSVVH
jgi:hypothetical protein